LDTLLPPHSSRKEASISYRCTAVLGLTKDEWPGDHVIILVEMEFARELASLA